ncbi:TfoX/Sxy family protein [Conexibacter sp. JD483]|uniref:TfoX/Sxy family protein n=1 Tax=unclassified Conexibacter TaxID=2627773 RepID=UPI0027276669|nr:MULTISPECIES: TfoX/Sxy family protein [unclassified Conexibacter]MDO8189373.1 TfoX/Sxy family protein [Conexibacter sp. CPCC 205706]MDO8201080.1 TfoX/Sxy family protein [Conexibacter sp. CPCC 205762]MDR9372458.1 TfoX/Sxy family protein [Conexibacter sp. JD483]
MAHDEQLAARVRALLAGRDEIAERRMFGGLAFMAGGRLACAVLGDALLVRLGADAADAALDEPHVRPMDFTGRPSRGSVFVDPAGTAADAALADWVERGVAFAAGR